MPRRVAAPDLQRSASCSIVPMFHVNAWGLPYVAPLLEREARPLRTRARSLASSVRAHRRRGRHHGRCRPDDLAAPARVSRGGAQGADVAAGAAGRRLRSPGVDDRSARMTMPGPRASPRARAGRDEPRLLVGSLDAESIATRPTGAATQMPASRRAARRRPENPRCPTCRPERRSASRRASSWREDQVPGVASAYDEFPDRRPSRRGHRRSGGFVTGDMACSHRSATGKLRHPRLNAVALYDQRPAESGSARLPLERLAMLQRFPDTIATAFVGIFDTRTNTIAYANVRC